MGHVSATFVLGTICLLIWLYLFFLHGGFWQIRIERQPTPATLRRVIAVIPARNEADVIGRAIHSLLAQTGVDLSIILVDDHSDDLTADVARQAAKALSAEDRLTDISAPPLPEGWTGKLWAVQQGIELSQKSRPDFILLTDADIEHSPENVASLAARAEKGNYDLTSYMVKLECSTFPERLLIPAFVYFFFQLYPPKWIRNPRSPIAGAAGGCMLVRPEALQRAAAMDSLRGEIIDDCALAKRIKQSGGSVWLGPTDSAHSIRPYESFGEIERMIARSAFNQLRHSAALLAIAIIGLLLTYVVPVVLLFSPVWPLGLAASALMLATYSPMVRFYRLNTLWAFTLPLAAVFYLIATIHSALRYWTGRGGEWKGRAQDRASAGASHA
jgi:hopene-associated glycosyltransferase HpnB